MEKTPQAIQSCHELVIWLIPQLDKFPRQRRFTLGELIENAVLDVLEALVAAAYSQDKRADLLQANRRINTARHLWRMAFELKTIGHKPRNNAGLVTSDMPTYKGYAKSCLMGNNSTGICLTNARLAVRGGSWNNNARNLRSANRNRNTATNRNNNLGFRLAQSGRCLF